MITIPFNKPFLSGNETRYIEQAVKSGKISGNGIFTQKCQQYFEQRYGFGKCLITTSCTDALEMAAILCNLNPGDEVIVPSYTFVSTALAFARQGAKLVFADSSAENPNIDPDSIEGLISEKTKALVIVHYGGMACDMDRIVEASARHHLILIEDCAQAICSQYKGRPLGSFGQMSTFSFHETKNVICGEGGMLAINSPALFHRAEVIWEKGTNRADFSRGIVSKYEWMDTGSSFLPSEITTAFLWGQLENCDNIQRRRIAIWLQYYGLLHDRLSDIGISTSNIAPYATCNGHLFYLLCRSYDERKRLMEHLGGNGILAVSHYLSLHRSPYYRQKLNSGPSIPELPNSDRYEKTLLRLPLYYELETEQVNHICNLILQFYNLS
ncbi:MAG: dTDP-4-amino-4,6-dideoxygalactose transaminase [Bacteroidales bacterium]|nr:dTDP-4-amino-4,6-dideoxygalactose transaminase [Bacteroidales bacterium]